MLPNQQGLNAEFVELVRPRKRFAGVREISSGSLRPSYNPASAIYE